MLISNLSIAQTAMDSSAIKKTVVKTKFGPITFNQFCKEDISTLSLNYFFVDYQTDQDAEANKISTDTVLIELHIDANGLISDTFIIREGVLNNFTVLVKEIFEELKIEMKKQNQYLKCDIKSTKYLLPVIYTYN